MDLVEKATTFPIASQGRSGGQRRVTAATKTITCRLAEGQQAGDETVEEELKLV